MAERHRHPPRSEAEDECFDPHGYLTAVLDAVGDLRTSFAQVSAAVIEPPVSLKLVGGNLDDVRIVLVRAGIRGRPTRARPLRLPTGAVALDWAQGELGAVAVRVTWIVPNPQEIAGQLEAAEFGDVGNA